MRTILAAAILAILPATALADAVNQVSYASLTGTQLVTFDDLAGGVAPGTNYDSFVVSGGVGLGEHFQGQTVGDNSGFDTLSGAPSGGSLTLVAGSPGRNLNIFDYNGSNVLTGLGSAGFPDFNAIGEGAFSVLFSSNQSQFGFQLVGGDNGNADISFFRADGSLIQSLTVSNLANNYYGFARDGGTQDIRGISITNFDGGGIGFDNLKFDVRSSIPQPGIPEPSAWALMILGFGAAGAALRSRRGGLTASRLSLGR